MRSAVRLAIAKLHYPYVACLILLLATLLLLPRAAPAAEDALLGKWLGTAGSAKETIEVGLEFRRNAEGKLVILTTQPVSNLFGTDMGGEVVRDGDSVSSAAMFLNLRLQGDTLSGTYPGPNSPATFKRARTLPVEQTPPRLPTGPAPRWEARLSGQVYASPVAADGVAYVGTTGGILNAINVDDGKQRWAFSAGRPIYGAVALTADSVYFAADNGFLFCLDRADGKERWRYALGDAAVTRVLPHPFVYDWDWQGAQPVVAGDTVYIGAGDGGLHAVDAASGQRRWRFDTRGRLRNAVAVAGGKVYVGSADHFVYALDAQSGRELWRSDTGAEVDAAPVVHAGRVLVGNRGAGLLSLDAASGETRWRLFFWGSWVESTPVVRDGVIYVGSSDLRRVSAINPEDGHVLWRSDVFGWNWGTPLVTERHIYVGAAGGTPYFIRHQASFSVLDRKTGRLLTRWPLADTGGHQWGIAGSPALAGDSVIVATIAGSLLAFPLQP